MALKRLLLLSTLGVATACGTPDATLDVPMPAQLRLEELPEESQLRFRAVVRVPGVLSASELEIDAAAGVARGTFPLAAERVDDAEVVVSFLTGLDDTSAEVLVGESRGTINIRKGKTNKLTLDTVVVSGEPRFDVNRNGRSNIDDLILGLDPAPVGPPLQVFPQTINFDASVTLGGFSRQFLVLENTAGEPVDATLAAQLAPGVTLVPLESLFENGAANASRELSVTIGPGEERVMAVTFAPVNPLFLIGRVAISTVTQLTQVRHGIGVRVIGNPDGAVAGPPSGYAIPAAPLQVDGYTGTIASYPTGALFSSAPVSLGIPEADVGGIALSLERTPGTVTDETVDVDFAHLLVVPAGHRFSIAVDGLVSDVDVYLVTLEDDFSLPSQTLVCSGGADRACSTNLGTSGESAALDSTGSEEDVLLLIAYDRVGEPVEDEVAVGVAQTGLFAVPEFLPPCAPDDTSCEGPIQSSEACPAGFGQAVACGAVGGGAQLTLRGRNFSSGATVTVGSITPLCSGVSSMGDIDTIRCSIPTVPFNPDQPPNVSVAVRNPDGQTAVIADGFTYVAPAPQVFSVNPATGPTTGGMTAEISGIGFFVQDGAFPVVTLGGVAATVVTVNEGAGLISIVTPACPACADNARVSVSVTNPDGQQADLPDGFEYRIPADPPPVITAVNPAMGPSSGGTDISIEGSGFVTGVRAFVGGATAEVVTESPLVIRTPAAVAGGATVEVVNPDGQTARLLGGFTYTVEPPNITMVSPAQGTQLGGTLLTVSGSGFRAGASLLIGGVPATNVAVLGDTTVLCNSPAGTLGAADVVLTNLDGTSFTLTGGYTFEAAPAPTIAGVAPANGPVGGGTVLIVTGDGFQAGASVTVGGVLASGVTVGGPTLLTAVAPAGTPSIVDVVVQNPDGQNVTASGAFEYVDPSGPPPSILSVTPSQGPPGGGTEVTITGQDFTPTTAVFFSFNTAQVLSRDTAGSTDTIVAVAPAGAANTTVALRVQNSDGQLTTSSFTYSDDSPPAVVTTSPLDGEISVGVSNSILVAFSEPISSPTVDSSSFRLSGPSGDVPGTLSVTGNVVVMNPSGPLEFASAYTVLLSTGIQDVTGVGLGVADSFAFTTEAGGGGGDLTVTSTVPTNGAINVPTDTAITAVFDRALDPGTVTTLTVTVENGAGAPIAGSVGTTGNVVQFTPANPALISTDSLFTVTLTGGVGGIADLQGNELPMDFMYSFTTQSRQWSAPQTLDMFTTGSIVGPTVGVFPSGNAVVTWFENNTGSSADLDLSMDTWATPISAAATITDAPAEVAVGPSAHAIFSFTNSRISTTNRAPGVGTWSGTVQALPSASPSPEPRPDIQINSNGFACTTAAEPDETRYAVSANGGASWSQGNISRNGGLTGESRCTVDDSDRALYVWRFNTQYHSYIHYDAGFGTSVNVSASPATGVIGVPRLGGNLAGQSMLLYTEDDSGTDRLYGRRFLGSTATWDAINPISIGADDVTQYEVAMLTNGDAVAVFVQSNMGDEDLFGVYYDGSMDSWGTPVVIDSLTTPAQDPDIDVDAAGNAYAVWSQNDGVVLSIYFARYDSGGGTWSIPELLELNAEQARLPRIDVNASGDAAVTWEQFNGSFYDAAAVYLLE